MSIRHFVATRARGWGDSLHPRLGSEAIRSTHWGDSLHPGAVSGRFVRAMVVSSFLEDWHGVCRCMWHELGREAGVSHLVHPLRHGSVPILRGFLCVFHFLFDPRRLARE